MRATIKRGGRIEPRTATVRGMYNYIVKVGTDAQETRARGSSPLFSLRDRDFEIRRGRRLTRPPLPSRARIFTLSGPKHRPILFPLFSFFFFSIPSPTPTLSPDPVLSRPRINHPTRARLLKLRNCQWTPLIEDSSK